MNTAPLEGECSSLRAMLHACCVKLWTETCLILNVVRHMFDLPGCVPLHADKAKLSAALWQVAPFDFLILDVGFEVLFLRLATRWIIRAGWSFGDIGANNRRCCELCSFGAPSRCSRLVCPFVNIVQEQKLAPHQKILPQIYEYCVVFLSEPLQW